MISLSALGEALRWAPVAPTSLVDLFERHEVYLAFTKGLKRPRLQSPPVRIFHYDAKSFGEGVVVHKLDGVPVPIYTPEKSLADCFKF